MDDMKISERQRQVMDFIAAAEPQGRLISEIEAEFNKRHRPGITSTLRALYGDGFLEGDEAALSASRYLFLTDKAHAARSKP